MGDLPLLCVDCGLDFRACECPWCPACGGPSGGPGWYCHDPDCVSERPDGVPDDYGEEGVG